MKRTGLPDRSEARKSDAPSRRVSIWRKHMKTPSTLLSLNKFRTLRRVAFSWAAAAFIVLAILTIGVFVVQALARTWGNTGTDYNTGSSWSGGTAPGAGDVGQFSSAEVTQPILSSS